MNCLAAISLSAILCMSLLAALPNFSLAQTSAADTTTYWKELAQNAWSYFQPGNGLNPATGLHNSQITYPYFTDWDLGAYIQAIIDADKIGLANQIGWDTNSRLNKVLTFLENRPLTPDKQPYAWYSTQTGKNINSNIQVAWDAGNLLAALKNAETYKPNLKARIDNIVYTRTNYEPLAKVVNNLKSVNVYDYYLVSDFAAFWPNNVAWPSKFTTSFSTQANTILNNIANAPTIQTYGVTLPKAELICEPLLLSIFNLQSQDPRLLDLTRKVYLAHQAKSNVDGKYAAYSEGNTGGIATDPSGTEYVYEFVAQSNGRTWVVQNTAFVQVGISPIAYLKIAASFLALYNTGFAANMTDYLLSHTHSPTRGFEDGVDQNGRVNMAITDKTNSMIISAARYAIANIATPDPTPNPISSPTPTPTASQSPTNAPSPSPTASPNSPPTPLPSPTPNQTPTQPNTDYPPSTTNPEPSPSSTVTPNTSPTASPTSSPSQTPTPTVPNDPHSITPSSTSPTPNTTHESSAEPPASPQTPPTSQPVSNPTNSPNPPNEPTPTTTPANNIEKSSTPNPKIITAAAIATVVAICIFGTQLNSKRKNKIPFQNTPKTKDPNPTRTTSPNRTPVTKTDTNRQKSLANSKATK